MFLILKIFAPPEKNPGYATVDNNILVSIKVKQEVIYGFSTFMTSRDFYWSKIKVKP